MEESKVVTQIQLQSNTVFGYELINSEMLFGLEGFLRRT